MGSDRDGWYLAGGVRKRWNTAAHGGCGGKGLGMRRGFNGIINILNAFNGYTCDLGDQWVEGPVRLERVRRPVGRLRSW